MNKLDLSKEFKSYYSATSVPAIVELPEAQYLSIVGKGDPSSEVFVNHIQALYPVAYAIKFICKDLDKDFVVPKLEGQWWFDKKFGSPSIADTPKLIPRSEWEWRLMIRMPDFVTKKIFNDAILHVREKKNITLASAVKLTKISGGLFCQILHLGPFATEPESLHKLEFFMKERDLKQNGLHQEIYLSDFRKTDPAKLKTILREPVKL